MKINQPLSDEARAEADAEHARTAQNQIDFLNEVAALIESGQPLSNWQRKWAAGAIRGFAASIPLERKKGYPVKVPEESIVLLQVYINGGMKRTEAEERLAELYAVDIETLQKRIQRLAKEMNPAEWGFVKWGTNKK